jgi:hypothetical protein
MGDGIGDVCEGLFQMALLGGAIRHRGPARHQRDLRANGSGMCVAAFLKARKPAAQASRRASAYISETPGLLRLLRLSGFLVINLIEAVERIRN